MSMAHRKASTMCVDWKFVAFVLFFVYVSCVDGLSSYYGVSKSSTLEASDEDGVNHDYSSSEGTKPYWSKSGKFEKLPHAVPAGNTVRFLCPVEGYPTPVVIWFKNGQIIQREDRVGRYKYRNKRKIIILEYVVLSDTGLYMCKASNVHGSINQTYELDVNERSAHRPILQPGLPTNQTVLVGDNVTFKCEVYGDPHPHIRWLRHIRVNNSKVGPATDQYTVIPIKASGINTIDSEVLILQNVTLEDAGKYTCLAGNIIGISHQSAWLKVLPDNSSAVGKKPYWIIQKELHDELAGNTVRFRCPVAGKPTPIVTWYKNGHIVQNEDRVSGYKYRSQRQMIILESIIVSDEGLYMCKASNIHGSINRTYELDVI